MHEDDSGFCLCGCGLPVQHRWRHGHNKRKYVPGYVVDEATGCWTWTGREHSAGYGTLTISGKHVYAHRWMWEQFHGPIPAGTELDHTCRNPICCNPDHVEPVTHRENILRGCSPTAVSVQTGMCKKGLHELSGDNLYIQPKGGTRLCRACRSEYSRRRQ